MNIIELARQAGLKRHQEQAPGIDGVVGNWEDLERFAELVEAAARANEREQIAAWYETEGQMTFPVAIPKIIRAGGTT